MKCLWKKFNYIIYSCQQKDHTITIKENVPSQFHCQFSKTSKNYQLNYKFLINIADLFVYD